MKKPKAVTFKEHQRHAGQAACAKLTPAQRSERARRAVMARWKKAKRNAKGVKNGGTKRG